MRNRLRDLFDGVMGDRGRRMSGALRDRLGWSNRTAAAAAGALGAALIVIILLVAFTGGGDSDDVGETSPTSGDVSEGSVVEPLPEFELTAARRSDLDLLVEEVTTDLADYWTTAFPDIYGEPYLPLAEMFAYRPSAGESLSCGGSVGPAAMSSNALYCSAGDYVVWDDDFLFPNLFVSIGDQAVGAVLGHLWAHAMQERFDVDASPVVRELQADCFAGAWIGNGLSGLGSFDLDQSDLEDAVAGMLLVRDLPGSPIEGRQGHGSVFDRVRAFREGVEVGAEHCSGYEQTSPAVVDLVLPDPGGPRIAGSLDETISAITADLDIYWSPALRDLPRSTTIGLDESTLAERRKITGNFGSALMVAHARGSALVQGSGASDPQGLVADCLAGVWAGDVAYLSNRSFELRTGDLSAGFSALIIGYEQDDALAFDRLTAFEFGFFEGDLGTLDSVELCGG